MLDISTAWKNSAQLSKKSVALVRLHYGDETNYITIASGSIQGFDEEYRPMLLSSPVSTSGVDMFTHKFQASDIRLRVSNGDYHPGVKFSDLVNTIGSGNDIGFENRQCEIRLWTKGITTWNDCVQFFNGVVREITHSATEITFSIQDKREIIHTLIDHTLLDADAADTDQGLPEISRGLMKPVIHGDHTWLKADDSKASDTVSTINTNISALYLGVDSTGRHRWWVSRNIMNEILVAGTQAQLWAKDTKLGRLVRVANDGGTDLVVEQNTSSGCIVSTLAITQYLDYFYGKGTPTTDSLGADLTLFANTERISDKDFTTFSRGSLDPDTFNADFTGLIVPYGEWENQQLADSAILEIVLDWYGEATFAGGADGTKYVINFIQTAGPPATGTEPDTGGIYPDARMDDPFNRSTKVDIATSIRFNLIATGAFDADDQVILDIYQMYKAIRYEPGELLLIISAGKGREYNESTTWINSRTQTETHADNNGGGNLIQNLAGNLESLYRDELGRVDADIDLDSFNVASNDNTGVFAFSITEITKSLPLINKLCQDGRAFIWLEPSGLVKMKVLEDEYTASNRTLDFKTLINPKVSRTDPKRIFTAVKVRYNWDGSKFNKETAIAEDTVYQTKYNLTEAESTLIYDAVNISDTTTAEALRTYLLAQWKQFHNLLEFGVGIDQFELDTGEIVDFSNMPFKIFGEDITDNTTTRPSGEQVINKFWWIYNVRRTIFGSTYKAFQLHKLD